MTHVLAFHHVPFEHPGLIAGALPASRLTYRKTLVGR
jgi:hypothetical protein